MKSETRDSQEAADDVRGDKDPDFRLSLVRLRERDRLGMRLGDSGRDLESIL
jgi:hypothetical protein